MSSTAAQIACLLTTAKGLTPNQAWLSAFLTTQRPTTPLPALTQTACFRLLASDITTSLVTSPSTCFPQDISNPSIAERRIPGSIAAQILAVEDVSKSRWEQIEDIEALERGEGTKGRGIIRVVVTGEDDDVSRNIQNIRQGGGLHKLLLQDAAGKSVYGIELSGTEGVELGMSIGSKIVLKNALVARGVVLIEPATSMLLGGKVEEWHKAWKENRKGDLKAALERNEQTTRTRT